MTARLRARPTDVTLPLDLPGDVAQLVVSDLDVAYGSIPAVNGLSVTVGAGRRVAILGRNGAGKSTTLRAVAGLTAPSHGKVELEGDDITRLSPDRRVELGLCLVPEGRGVFADLSVRDNLAMGCFHRRLTSSQVDEEIEWAGSHFPRLLERLPQLAGSLSGGEQQMLAIARALLGKPRVLLIDEPSLGLAPKIVSEIYDLLRELHRGGLSIVVVEQYVNLALEFADYVYVLDKGAVALEGPAHELRESPALVEVYMAGGAEGPAADDPAEPGRRDGGTATRHTTRRSRK